MKKKKIGRKHVNVVFSILLSTLLIVQGLSGSGLLLAATTDTPVPTGTTVPQTNPSTDIINQKLEMIAKEKQIPSVLLKAIAYQESTWRQFDSQGNPLMSRTVHPAIGIMQVATYNDSDLDTIQKLKTDIDFNIRWGADLLNEKWAFVPKIGDGDRNKLENWYFALWAYNIWSGKNNPNEASSQTTSGSTSTTQGSTGAPLSNPAGSAAGNSLPVYQDRLLNVVANPPSWLSRYIQAVTITRIPTSSLPATGVPQAAVQWTTPQPFHLGDLATGTGSHVIPSWTRLQGTDRIDTAIQQALKGWPQGSNSVILARADDFPDALAGVPLAAQLNAPILLTSPKDLDSRVVSALKVLHPQNIYLLGGTGAIGTGVTAALEQKGWGQENLIRISGESRYGTAASLAIAASATSLSSLTTKGVISFSALPQTIPLQNTPAVVLATGDNFPDALSIASIAGVKKMPILLTSSKVLPAESLEALKRLHPAKIYIIGGEGVISSQIEQALPTALGISSSQIKRLSGANRYDTMTSVAQEFQGDIQKLSFATGEDFPDALAGAALAAHQNSAVILLPKTSISEFPTLKTWIKGKLQSLSSTTDTSSSGSSAAPEFYLLGGVGAITQELESELKSLSSL
ncbi:cell wall-binding repeat-containing protein [Desulfitobacterium sp. AusDCA]|uniref:cell wall-binding repeat-containing protein n=1 Tax=Desulfitobacterium sp. AusDCA TaxID=3240383 RepID=UPI003DA73E97